MKLVSVNVSMPKTLDHLGRRVSTGIYNEPVAGRVFPGSLLPVAVLDSISGF